MPVSIAPRGGLAEPTCGLGLLRGILGLVQQDLSQQHLGGAMSVLSRYGQPAAPLFDRGRRADAAQAHLAHSADSRDIAGLCSFYPEAENLAQTVLLGV